MTTTVGSSNIQNGEIVRLKGDFVGHFEAFHRTILSAVAEGQRVAAFFGHRQLAGNVRLYAVLADDHDHCLSLVATDVRDSFPSLTPECPQVHLFEREIHEQFGVTPLGHPWLKAVRAHAFDGAAQPDRHPFFAMEGEEVHEVAVGPVHAGVIEPGHFRFQCHGEIVHHLEIQLGYQHRGVEEALAGGPHKRTLAQIETVAGDTTIGHATAYCRAVESLCGMQVPARAQAIRAIALELERLANHIGDMAALANDVGFLPTASYCGRLRADFLNMTALVCGSRFGRGLVRSGGVGFDVDDGMVTELLKRLDRHRRDVRSAIDLFFDTRSVVARLEDTGTVTREQCEEMGIVGMAARASGLTRDARMDHPWGWYRDATIPTRTWETGDVMGRAMVRWLEIQASMAYIKEQLQRLPAGMRIIPTLPAEPNALVVSITEGWRGEIVHVAITDAQGRFARYKVIDPSFHNWFALTLALRDQQISDFPLCNKSFNLSYCGFDL